MRDANVSLIRVGESVWSTWEPAEGRFELDWLAPVLDGAHERGIEAIVGTPTYAVPPWMARLHPEVAGEETSGRPLTWGARQEADFTHPAFRHYAERVIRKIIARYADHPAVIGFQVDNEPGLRLLHNHGIFEQFIDHLKDTYGDVQRLNAAWGLVYWSHQITRWDELWVPDGNLQPQYDLAWRRFQARLVDEFIAWQADLVREVAEPIAPEKFVTTCISYDQAGVEDVDLSTSLDVASANVYYTMQEGLRHPSDRPMSDGWIIDGTWAVYQLADLAYSSKQAPFLVTETNAAAIGHGSINTPAFDGQWRQIAWALISRGAEAIEYWHWNTLHYGAETYWGGVLPHDGTPGRVFSEIARIGTELAAAGDTVTGLRPDADVAFLYSSESKWALAAPAVAPLLDRAGGPDPDSYRRLALPFYRGAFDAGLQINTVRPSQVFGNSHTPGVDPAEFAALRPVLVAAATYVLRAHEAQWLTEYARTGGHLVLGPRTGYADDEARAHTDAQPAGLARAAGVSYQEFETLRTPVEVHAGPGAVCAGLAIPADATATLWSDYLVPDGARILVEYADTHRRCWPAIVTHAVGAGRITTVGAVPGQSLAEAFFAWLVPTPVSGWASLPVGVRVTSAASRDGGNIYFVHNWTPEVTDVTVPQKVRDVTDPSVILDVTDRLELAPWDVRVFQAE